MDFFRKHTRLLPFVLVLLIVPSFVFLGVQGYSRFDGGNSDTVAKVAGRPITQAEWDAAHRDRVEQARRQMPDIDAKLFDSPEVKRRALDELVRQRVLLAAADKLNLVTTDEHLLRRFVSDPQFATVRNADGSVNKDALAQRGMSSDMFAQRLRQEISTQQVLLGVGVTALAPGSATAAAFDALHQQREVQVLRFDVKDYASKVSPSEAELEKFYADPANSARFTAPEQASIEYVVLELAALKKDLTVSGDEVRNYYDQNLARYTSPEERRASHILIKADEQMSSADRAKAKTKAESLLAELRTTPAAFAELARKHSEDPGSAERGGDLDFFGRGAMVKPFEDAVFGLDVGEISPVVESDFGYHIIQVVARRGGVQQRFESVRAEIEDEIKRQLAQQRFSEAAVEFTNTAYEQPGSLQPLSDKLKLEVQTAQGVRRTPPVGATGPLASPKFLEALFSDGALRNKHNTEAVETGPSQMVAGRVVEYKAAHKLPFAEVRPVVRAAVIAEQAAALARNDGLAQLASLRRTPDGALNAQLLQVSRVTTHDLPQKLVNAALNADATKLPSVIGVDLGARGYAVVKVTKVLGRDPAAGDPTQSPLQYAQAWGAAEAQAYYDALKTRFEVDIEATSTATTKTAAENGAAAN